MFKDVTEFFDERIKSPFYTYIAFSFLATNWQPLFYLFFADKSVVTRFAYFNINTDFISLFIIPIIVGALGALAAPYLSHWGAWWAENPTKKKKLRQVKVALDIRKARADMEKVINQQVDEAIKSALQDQEIAQIDDKDLRDKISEEVQKLRSEITKTEVDLAHPNIQNYSKKNNQLNKLNDLRMHYVKTSQVAKMKEVDEQIESILLRNAEIK